MPFQADISVTIALMLACIRAETQANVHIRYVYFGNQNKSEKLYAKRFGGSLDLYYNFM